MSVSNIGTGVINTDVPCIRCNAKIVEWQPIGRADGLRTCCVCGHKINHEQWKLLKIIQDIERRRGTDKRRGSMHQV